MVWVLYDHRPLRRKSYQVNHSNSQRNTLSIRDRSSMTVIQFIERVERNSCKHSQAFVFIHEPEISHSRSFHYNPPSQCQQRLLINSDNTSERCGSTNQILHDVFFSTGAFPTFSNGFNSRQLNRSQVEGHCFLTSVYKWKVIVF